MSDFKIGARVVIVDDHEDNWPPVIGELGTIVGRDDFIGSWIVNLDTDDFFSYNAQENELLVLKYAVGDRVRLVQDLDQEGFLEIGALGTVAKLAPYGHQADYEVHWDGLEEWDSCLVQQEELGEPLVLGVGDRVRVAVDGLDTPVGSVGTIVPMPDDRLGLFEHYVEFDNFERIGGFLSRDLEQVRPEDSDSETYDESEPFTDIPLLGVIEISIEESQPETYGDLLEKMVIRSKIAADEVQGDSWGSSQLRDTLRALPGMILANDGAEDIVWTLFE